MVDRAVELGDRAFDRCVGGLLGDAVVARCPIPDDAGVAKIPLAFRVLYGTRASDPRSQLRTTGAWVRIDSRSACTTVSVRCASLTGITGAAPVSIQSRK